MSMDLIPYVQLEENNAQRTPCVIVVDGSSSMAGPSIDELNAGLQLLENELKNDDIARTRVQILIVRAGRQPQTGVNDGHVLAEWTDAMDFVAPTVSADGMTPLGQAVDLAMRKVVEQQKCYKDYGIASTRPWMFILSDGAPNDDDWEQAAQRCKTAESKGHIAVFAIGTSTADLSALGKFSSRHPQMLQGLKFKEFFLWLSRSLSSASSTAPGQPVQAPANNWGVIPT